MQTTSVRFLALDRDYAELRDRYDPMFRRALESGQVVGGPLVEELEREIASRVGRRHAVAVGSGTDAVWACLVASGVVQGMSVAVPALSYIASGTAVVRSGAVPVFIDVDEHGHLRQEEVEALLASGSIDAVLAIGLYGDGLDDAPLRSACDAAGVLLLEDAAQSLGSRHRSRAGGALGRASALSFAPTKNLACFGNGGAVVTDDAAVAERVRALRVHGKGAAAQSGAVVGANSQLASMQAAQLLVASEVFEQRQRRRGQIASWYLEALSGLRTIEMPRLRSGCEHNWHKFVVRTEHRDELRTFLAARGIETQVHYALTLPQEPALRVEPAGRDFPVAERISRTCLSLPLHPHLAEEELRSVAEGIRSFEAQHGAR